LVGPGPALEVDGGIDAATAGPCAAAGATLFVAGTSVFGADDPGIAVSRLESAISTASDQVRPTV
jgi:ribulose-phosphate 3-epimerase